MAVQPLAALVGQEGFLLMMSARVFASAAALACVLALTAVQVQAKPADYRFELAGKPQPAPGGKSIVPVRLVHLPDTKPVTDAVVFETKADMGPMGMPTMMAPIKAVSPAQGGVYRFEVEPGMAGAWAITLAAKVQGEAETIRGSVTADLVK
jgi:hypothetical protein